MKYVVKMSGRFKDWEYPEFDKRGMTKWNWMCQYQENLKLGENTDVGAFACVSAETGKYGNTKAR
jgi:hypothetical protein